MKVLLQDMALGEDVLNGVADGVVEETYAIGVVGE